MSLLSDRVSSHFLRASPKLPNQNSNPLSPVETSIVPIKEKLYQMELHGQGKLIQERAFFVCPTASITVGGQMQWNSTKQKVGEFLSPR